MFGGALRCGALRGCTLFASGCFASFGTFLRKGGLTNALGFGIGFRLLGLLLDLIELVELPCQHREGEEGQG
ncbi:hypothetical protein D9M73_284190 [compost metagenome]